MTIDIAGKYILDDDGNPVPEPDLMKWSKWLEQNKPEVRRIRRSELQGCIVSTVFLGLDHSFGEGPPLLFETMIFGGPLDQEQDRYSTREQAIAGHTVMVERHLAAVKAEQGLSGFGKRLLAAFSRWKS